MEGLHEKVRNWFVHPRIRRVSIGLAGNGASFVCCRVRRHEGRHDDGLCHKDRMDEPHVWFYVNIKNPDGTTTNWGFEMGPPHGLQNRGWTRTTMKLGDEVIVNGTVAKNGSNRVNARSVTMAATGQKLGAASSEAETP